MNASGVVLARWRMIRNRWSSRRRSASKRKGGHPAVGVVLALALALLVGTGLSVWFGSLAAAGATAEEAAAVLGWVLAATIVGLLVFDIHHAVASLLVDSDLELLRRAPVTPVQMLAVKLVDALPRTASLLVIVAIPAVVAWADRYPLPAWGWGLVPILLAGYWLIPLGAATALAVWLLRFVPPRRAREALGLLSTAVLVLLWLANAFLLPRLAESSLDLTLALRQAGPPSPILVALSPGHLVSRVLAFSHEGSAAGAIGVVAWLVSVALLVFGVGAWAAGRHVFALQGTLTAARPRVRTDRRGGVSARRTFRSVPFLRATLRRDRRVFLRDWTVLGDVLTAALLWTLLPLVASSLVTAAPALIVRTMLVMLTVGLGYEIAARSIPFERRAACWALLAPVEPTRWVLARLAGAAALALPLFGLAATSLALVFPLSARDWAGTLSLGLSSLAVALSLGLLTGLHFGDPQWTNPRGMLTLSGRILSTGLLLGQAITWLALAAYLGMTAGGLDLWLPPAIAGTLTTALGALLARRLERLGHFY